MAVRRLTRSSATPAGSRVAIRAIAATVPTTPAWTGEPVTASTSSGNATRDRLLPRPDSSKLPHSRLKSRFRRSGIRSIAMRLPFASFGLGRSRRRFPPRAGMRAGVLSGSGHDPVGKVAALRAALTPIFRLPAVKGQDEVLSDGL